MKKDHIQLRIDAELKDQFYRKCQEKAINPSEWLRLQIKKFLKEESQMDGIKYFASYDEAAREAEGFMGYEHVEVFSHDFGVIAEESGDNRVQYYISTEQGTLRRDGYIK